LKEKVDSFADFPHNGVQAATEAGLTAGFE